jgi:hypothetical protein
MKRFFGGSDMHALQGESSNYNEGLQNTSPPKPDRIELLKQGRRATIDDQLHLLRWLETKFEKIKTREEIEARIGRLADSGTALP